MRYAVVLLVMLASGCRQATYDVPEQYRPLERIVESVLRPGTAITTVGPTARVWDLDDWLAKHPPGSPAFHAILMHERDHTTRQLAMGLTKWLGRYLTDTEFMRGEELRGWYIQIQEYRRRGISPDPEGVARILAGSYMNFAGRMMSYEDALTWVRDVLAGRWKPEKED